MKIRDDGNYRNLDLEYLEPSDLHIIEIKAKGLSLDDCFDYLLIDKEHIPAAELLIAQKAWRRGRTAALSTAVDKLFSSMETRNGGSIALEYLRTLSTTFHLEPSSTGTNSVGGFSFNIVMPEKDEQ